MHYIFGGNALGYVGRMSGSIVVKKLTFFLCLPVKLLFLHSLMMIEGYTKLQNTANGLD